MPMDNEENTDSTARENLEQALRAAQRENIAPTEVVSILKKVLSPEKYSQLARCISRSESSSKSLGW